MEERNKDPMAEFCNIRTPVWGETDCCMSVCNYYRDVLGIDFATNFRGKYNTPIKAYRLLSKAGGFDKLIEEAGFKEIPKQQARDGDLAMRIIPRSGRQLGIVNGSEAFFSGGVRISFLDAEHIYRREQ